MSSLLENRVFTEIAPKQMSRHPRVQRNPSRLWGERCGPFNEKLLLNPLHIVADGNGGYHIVDGGHRKEACEISRRHGPNFKLPCYLYGNGKVPSDKELAHLFEALNSKQVKPSVSIELKNKRIQGDPIALFVEQQLKRLPHMRTEVGLWRLASKHGEQLVEQTLDFVIATWGDSDPAHWILIKAVAWVLQQKGGSKALDKRRKTLQRKYPESARLVHDADFSMLRVVGKREPREKYVIRMLLGTTRLV